MKVLLVEDDEMIGESVHGALRDEGFSVDWVKDGNLAEAALDVTDYDAVMLDLGLPDKDGVDVLRTLRTKGKSLPVLVVTARDSIAQRVQGLNIGADDYLVKPFDLEELIARLHAVIRRARGGLDQIYKSGNISVNLTTRQVLNEDAQIVLSAREWTVLEALIARPGAILSRSQLEEKLYGWSGDVESNAVEVYIHGLRKKLGQKFILNVRGLGYMVDKGR
jgi:DNA-binding response OmpR family regulator